MKKRILSMAIVLILVFALFPATALASSEIIVFPDPNFKAALLAEMGKQPTAEITKAEVAWVTFLDVEGYGISDLSGIEHFTSLQIFGCANNQLTALDVSKNPALRYLRCYNNQLTALDVSKNPALESLECGENQLAALDVSKNPALYWLSCYDNGLTALDVSKNPMLENLYCNDNQLTELGVSNNPALEELWCQRNQLTTLDVSKNPALGPFRCSENQITALDVSNNPALTELYCDENQLTALDVSNNPALEWLICSWNQVAALNVRSNPVLRGLVCSGNQLTTLDVSNNAAIEGLSCSRNQLTSIDVSGLSKLAYLDCDYNNMTDGSNVFGVGDTLLPAIDTGEYPNAYYIFSPQNDLTPPVSNFAVINRYVRGQFSDVDENQWYGVNNQNVIGRAYEYGLMKGNVDGSFNPMGNVSIAEAITIAARVHNIYNGGSGVFAQGEPWYQVYVDYALSNGIIQAGNFTDYDKTATRAEMAYIFSRSLPPTEFAEQNTVNSLPDVNSSTPYSDAILLLYKAGVVTGDTGTFAFRPGDNVSRAEAAAIISRVILPGMRTTGRVY